MVSLLIHWILSAASLTAIAKLLPGVRVQNFGTALMVAAVYGLLHLVIFKVFALLLFLPRLLTLGLFDLIVNGAILFVTDKLIDNFEIDNVLTTLIAAVLLTILNNIWGWIL